MTSFQIEISSAEDAKVFAFLDERIYEFNVETTGIPDGKLLSASIEDESGRVVAGIAGHTWGGCCEILRLWVHESRRRDGIGTALMDAAEAEARRRGCQQIVLSTHSFQAPGFYEKLGFQRVAAIQNYPRDHEQIFFVKHLDGRRGS